MPRNTIKIKICGITNLEDALFSSQAGAHALGFIFTKKSPRYINPVAAKKIISKLDPFIVKVGVFMDGEMENVRDIALNLGLDVLQLHGQESPAYCSYFKDKFKVVKVFFPHQRPFNKAVTAYRRVDAFMFDIQYSEKQTGKKQLSSDSLREIEKIIEEGKRVVISGGLTPDNLEQVKKINPYAVDVASGVEKLVGEKDKELVSLFIKRVQDEQ